MNTFEKIYSVAAIIFAIGLLTILTLFPQYQKLQILIPASFTGLLVNVGLMFITFRDIYLRHFADQRQKILWVIILLLFWPTILVYLPIHGFRQRVSAPSQVAKP